MKTIILFLLLSLAFTVNAEEFTGNLETEAAPYVNIDSVRPTQEELDIISRLSEKYIFGTISEEELSKLIEYRVNFDDLDVYRSDFQKTKINSTKEEGEDVLKNISSTQGEEKDITLDDAAKNQKTSYVLVLINLIFTLVNFIILMICLRKRK